MGQRPRARVRAVPPLVDPPHPPQAGRLGHLPLAAEDVGDGAPGHPGQAGNLPEPGRSTLNKIRAVIRAAAPPEATEVISYRIPTFKYKGMLIGFAAFSNHCSLFPDR